VLSINYHLGGGIPYGKIIELFGEESTGKTLLAKDFGQVTQSMGGVILWDDAECTFDAAWAVQHGLDLNRIQLLPQENRIEIISDWLADYIVYWRSKLKKNEPILVVIDSIAVLEGSDTMEVAEVDTKAEMGRRSYLLGKLLRKRTRFFAKYGVCVILINQLRKKVGASKFEDPDTTPMAQCLKYYASQRVGLYRGKRIKGGKKGKTWMGNVVYVRTKKNKTSTPRDNVQATVYFRKSGDNFGYHKYQGLPELLEEKKIIKRVAGKFYFKDKLIAKKEKSMGDVEPEDAMLRVITTDTVLRKQLVEKLDINTPSKFRKQLESIKENLYPVKVKATKDDDSKDTEG
jgi:recombination protein RecA